jgi:asparagine synthase (glutamine-hydrolysing)
MCGITGFISSSLNKDHLVKMTNSLVHRGPNAEGYYYNKDLNAGLGHRRLSIIDLSETANQPMISHCGNYLMIFNGEVYNYKEIAKELSRNWRTNSDSEVILEAFVEYGTPFIEKLNGMFAIAILDIKNNTLFLFRDRIGKKPLYYYLDKEELIFASEIKALSSIKNNLKINKNSISNFLHYGFIPNDESIYEQIKKLPAGSYGSYNNQKLSIYQYWNIDKKITPSTIKDIDFAKKELKNLLFDSVEKRLISDVPIGTFLSGGIDSSIVTSIASSISNTAINTFSIGYKNVKHDESKDAKLIAKHLKTNHHEFMMSENDILLSFDKVLDNFDEPFADSSCFPTYIVSEMAKKYATVCLSGDGGDELFMGYGAYGWANRLNNPLLWNLRKPISYFLAKSNSNRNKRAALVFDCPTNNRMSHIFSQEQYFFSEEELKLLLKNPSSSIFCSQAIKTNRNLSPKEQQSFFDIKNYLKDDLLVKVDRASMLNSLEVRVPLLDYKVVEFTINLDENLKISKSGIQKYILKELLYKSVPKNLLDRPKKGFSIPLDKWLKTDLHYLFEKYLNDDIIIYYDIFNLNYIKSLKSRFLNGENYLYNRLWQIILINRFLSKSKN